MITKGLDYFKLSTQNILIFLFVVGLYIPTTVSQWERNESVFLLVFIAGLILLYMRQRSINKIQLAIFIILNVLLIFFTYQSSSELSNPSIQLKYYAIIFVALLGTFGLDFSEVIKESQLDLSRYILNIVSILGIGMSLAIMFDMTLFTNIIRGGYLAFYDSLVPTMLSEGKPINTFGTHSIAGFYAFIFFLMNIFTFHKMKTKLNFVFSLFFMIFMITIKSTTSYAYFFIGGAMLMYLLFRKNRIAFYVTSVVIVIVAIFFGGQSEMVQMLLTNLFNKESKNGMGIRFGETGTITVQIKRILENPFKGTGYLSIFGTYYVDCGFTHFAQRLSLLGMVALYGSFFAFLKKNLGWIFAIILFMVYMSFEVGFSNLLYFRTIMMMPFIVFYFSQLLAYNSEKR